MLNVPMYSFIVLPHQIFVAKQNPDRGSDVCVEGGGGLYVYIEHTSALKDQSL